MTLAKQSFMLFWLQIKMKTGISAMKYYRRHDKKKYRTNIFIIIAIVYALCAFMFLYGLIYSAIVKSALALGLGSLMLAVTVLLAMIMVFLFGTFQINAVVFNAKDIEWYACLPLKPAAVFASKLGMVYLYELVITILLLLPAYLLYAIESGAGALFWIIAVLTLPLVPVSPLALSSLCALPLSKLSSKFRRRELMTTIFTIIIVGAFVGAEMSFARFMRGVTENSNIMTEFFTNSEPMMKLATSMFPPAMWLSAGLTLSSGAILSLLLFAGVSVLSLLAAVYLSGKLYYAGILSVLETPKVKSKKAKFRASSVKKSGAVYTLAKVDLMQIVRCPVYLVNSLSGIYFAVVMFILPFTAKDQWVQLKLMLSASIGNMPPAALLVIITLILTGIGLMNPAASTSISRMGRSFWVYQTIPLPPRTQIMAKLFSSMAISLFSTVLVAVCGCVIVPQLIPFVVMAFVPAALMSVSTSAFNMLPDVLNPKLRWDSEAEAMKQNFSSLWGMLLAICPVLILLMALPLALVMPGLNLTVMLAVLIILAAGTAFGSTALLRWTADSRFAALAEKM